MINSITSWLKWDNKEQQQKDVPLGDASEIIDGFLFLSDIVFIQEASLTKHGITHVCSVTPKTLLSSLSPSLFHLLSLSVSDSSQYDIASHFAAAHEFIERAKKNNQKVVVHCEVGMSRSPTVVIEAYHTVKSRRPIVQPNMGFIKQLLAYEKQLFGEQDIRFFAEYVKEVYRLEQSVDAIQEALEKENLDVNKAMLSLYPA